MPVRRLRTCVPMILLLLLLCACGGAGEAKGSPAEELALAIRGELLEMTACTAGMELTADYGGRVYEYTIQASYERDGETVLTVTGPEEIAGVTARIREGATALEYDGIRWETGALTPGGMSPIDAVPALLDYAREGFMAECGMETVGDAELLRVVYRDPEGTAGVGEACSLWFDTQSHTLTRGELSQDGFTVIQCAFTEFLVSQTEQPAGQT